MIRQFLYAVLAMAMAVPSASAVDYGAVSPTDPRVRYYDYHPEQVYSLTGYYGYVTPVFFRDDEKIQVATIGDSEAWQATPSAGRDMILAQATRCREPLSDPTGPSRCRKSGPPARSRRGSPAPSGVEG